MNSNIYPNYEVHVQFYRRILDQLNKTKLTGEFNGRVKYQVDCPKCMRHTGIMGSAKNGDTLIFGCPACGNGKGMNLNQLIRTHGKGGIAQDWQEATSPKNPYDWKPIKNRVPYKDRKPREKSFKEKQDQRSTTEKIKMLNQISK